jgi:glycosyltransferase involved in cell wall biosynthesis
MRSLKTNIKPEISFGIINCNRLFYLKSCLESLLETTKKYDNMEVIIVDNASVEQGTQEYLNLCEENNIRVFRTLKRDPSNEFARGLNTVVRNTTGWLVCPLQGDMQFIIPGWLPHYIEFANQYPDFIGSMTLDAQRSITINSHNIVKTLNSRFYVDNSRDPVAGAADCIYTRNTLNTIGEWNENNQQHEGGNDSETDYLVRFRRLRETGQLRRLRAIVPAVSPAVAIYTDPRGTNARVRGNRRYGSYWEPKQDNFYYKIRNDLLSVNTELLRQPMSIEQVAKPIGFDAPIGKDGVWLKNPINPTTALPSDYVELETL